MQKTKWTQGFILQRQHWRENDLHLTCFTQHFGKVKVVAFGAASTHSLRGQRSQLFRLLPMQLSVSIDAQGDYKNFNLVEVESNFTDFVNSNKPLSKQQLLRLASGHYVNECFLRLNQYLEIGQQPIDLMAQVFERLDIVAKQPIEFAIVLRHFELELFKLFGYDLYHFEPQRLEERWYYDLYAGWCVCNHSDSFLTHQEIRELAQLSSWQAPALNRLKYHNRQLMAELLGSDSLRSRNWVNQQLQII